MSTLSNVNSVTEKDYKALEEIKHDFQKNKLKIEEYINSNKPEFHVALSK